MAQSLHRNRPAVFILYVTRIAFASVDHIGRFVCACVARPCACVHVIFLFTFCRNRIHGPAVQRAYAFGIFALPVPRSCPAPFGALLTTRSRQAQCMRRRTRHCIMCHTVHILRFNVHLCVFSLSTFFQTAIIVIAANNAQMWGKCYPSILPADYARATIQRVQSKKNHKRQ